MNTKHLYLRFFLSRTLLNEKRVKIIKKTREVSCHFHGRELGQGKWGKPRKKIVEPATTTRYRTAMVDKGRNPFRPHDFRAQETTQGTRVLPRSISDVLDGFDVDSCQRLKEKKSWWGQGFPEVPYLACEAPLSPSPKLQARTFDCRTF
ncbi:hypothetical protein BDM02DRAFT_1245410 [Thelephora ganbajun]|uniref:Uncharacterized protein n=1 Tax=Thelephora ganbajun TaxID=370292 RepID=A0ACB6Z3Q9_THEGA|nr:hypothetical protein BDM02DRAFT_1245410 [Thelephora ganbajun]